ncbi:MAG: hypothetical protein R3B47_09125 [Bacteroidia bacterium]
MPRRPNGATGCCCHFVQIHVGIERNEGGSWTKLPRMTDPRHLAVIDIASSVLSAAYRSSPEMFAYLVIVCVITSVKHGNASASGFGYATYGVIRLAAFSNVFDRHGRGGNGSCLSVSFKKACFQNHRFLCHSAVNLENAYQRSDQLRSSREYRQARK